MKNKNLNAWLAHKRNLNKLYKTIKVTKERLVIIESETRSVASFIQTYKSTGYKAVGKKRLVLIREDNKWKIFRETWEKL